MTKPLVLIILDGWGYNESPEHNAIYAAKTPTWDRFWETYSHTLISGSGEDVGLPAGQMGNSEVGHLNIGAGRIVRQDYARIEKAIVDQEFFNNSVLLQGIEEAVRFDKAVHVFGLLSPGGVHAHECQIHALVELAARRGAKHVYVHAFLDGRDTPPKSAKASLEALATHFKHLEHGRIASITGRYYAMDRDKRWDRTQLAYDLLTQGQADFRADDPLSALEQAYQRGETDEFVKPTVIYAPGEAPVTVQDGDCVIFMNFRADRARQLTCAFTAADFDGFERHICPKLSTFVTLTQYATDIPAAVAFPPEHLENVLGDYLAKNDRTQLRLAETEKYAHVTYFFNGGIEQPFPNEDRVLVSSPKVETYDLQPEMSALELTDKLTDAIRQKTYDLIVCNFANADMVGHTGNFEATVTAVETLDTCLAKIHEALTVIDGAMIITADHGNAERMFNPDTDQAHTAHTNEPVPLVYVAQDHPPMKPQGILSDIAPTILYLLGLKPPAEMTGVCLFEDPSTP